jgi:hypothetical protein
VFGNIIQKDLDEFVADWNAKSSPHGHPSDIYDMPMLNGEYGHAVL